MGDASFRPPSKCWRAVLPAGDARSRSFTEGAHEGSYPTISACAGTFSLKFQTSFEGITLKYFYSGTCGSFARIENARTNCAAVAQRSSGSVARVDGWVSETVDPGINYAYTRIANNLSG
ncbi:hypothetical protein [Streptomyces sp. NPDC002133]|uniref:hypothetical protein n=1 Tax=Streptomyces sp. NPDC002133 TaxID=3154409 RepID=UPI0033279D8C